MKNYDSAINQKIKSDFVSQEVLCCDTMVVEYILNKSYEDSDTPFTWDDVEFGENHICPECGWDEYEEVFPEDLDVKECNGFYICPICMEKHGTKEEALQCCNSEDVFTVCKNCGKVFAGHVEDCFDEETTEIYEWWRVSCYLYNKLKNHNEIVLEGPNGYYWGRSCTGQDIYLDYVISIICDEIGLLKEDDEA